MSKEGGPLRERRDLKEGASPFAQECIYRRGDTLTTRLLTTYNSLKFDQ